jgi:hypothetical protein
VTGQQDRQGPALHSGLARSARQALVAAGYVSLEQLTQVTAAILVVAFCDMVAKLGL